MADTPQEASASDRDRLLAVYRGWKRALMARMGSVWLQQSNAHTFATALATFSTAILLPLDSVLWNVWNPEGWYALAPRSGLPVVLVFLVLGLAKLLLTSLWLTRAATHPERYRAWFRISLALLSGIPLLGFLALPAWHRMQTSAPRWALHRGGAEPPVHLGGQAGRRRPPLLPSALHRHADSGPLFLVVMLGDVAALLWGAAWLARAEAEGRLTHRSLLSVSLIAHVFVFLIVFFPGLRMGRLGRSQSPRLHRLLVAVSFLSLLPYPLTPFAGALPLMVLEPGMTRSATLVWQALAGRKGAGRWPLWLGLEDSLRRGWRKLPWQQRVWSPPRSVTRQPEPAPADVRILLLYDLGTFFLAFDAACLGWGLSRLAGLVPAWAPALQAVSSGLILTSFGLCGLALCLVTAHFVQSLLRLPGPLQVLDRQPYAVYAAKTQCALGTGLYFGWQLPHSDPQQIGMLMMWSCALFVVLKGFAMATRPVLPSVRWRRPRLRDEAPAILILFGLMILGGLGGPLELLPAVLAAWMFIFPLRAVLIGRWLLPWLVRPYAWREAFDPTLSPRLRMDLALLASSVLLPLGAVAIPWCIYIRHRRWPDVTASRARNLRLAKAL